MSAKTAANGIRTPARTDSIMIRRL